MDERLEILKKQYPDVWTLSVPCDDKGKDNAVAYLKKPDRNVISAALAMQGTNPLKAKEIILSSCWIEGDERIKTNDDLFISACFVMDKLIRVRKAELKKN